MSAQSSPRGGAAQRPGKAVGFDEVEDPEKGQAADRLAVATKKGAEREALSAQRDAAKMAAHLKKLEAEIEAKDREHAAQGDKLSKLELSHHKMKKDFDVQATELRKMTKLSDSRGEDLANLRKKAVGDLGIAQDKTKDATNKVGELSNFVADLEKQLSAAAGKLRSTGSAMERLTKDSEAANQKMLLMRDSVVKLEADLRDTSSRLRIESNELMKSEERTTKFLAEIKLSKTRLDQEQIRAGQCMSNLAQAKTELAVAIEAQAGSGMTPSIVLENDQLKLERTGFVAQIRGLTDTLSQMEVAKNNATRQLEKEKGEHVRFHMLYKDRTDELNIFKKRMNSAKEANRAAMAELDGKLMESDGSVKDLTRSKTAIDADLRAKTQHVANLQAEAKQFQKKIVSLKDSQTAQATALNNVEDELSRENKLRVQHETEAHLLTERLSKAKEQALSDKRSQGNDGEEMIRELAGAQAECVRLESQLKKERKAYVQAQGAKNAAAADQSKAMQKAQEHRERFEKAQISLSEAQQAMREEQVLRISAEKSNKKNETARVELETKLSSAEKDLTHTKTAFQKAQLNLKSANMELAVYKEMKENDMGPVVKKGPRDYSDMTIPHPPTKPRMMAMNDSGPLQTPNLDMDMGLVRFCPNNDDFCTKNVGFVLKMMDFAKVLPSGRRRRVRKRKQFLPGDDEEGEEELGHGYRDEYEPLNQFKKEIDRLSEPVGDLPGFGKQGAAASARAAARGSVSAR